MKLDFWNNPLVVSSFRVKYRRGGIFNMTAIYLMLLVAGGMVVYHYRLRLPVPWPQFYLIAMLGLQLVLSSLIAAGATTASLRSEVLNRTLDFQRLASISPQQILLGKLLGDPALAYLLAIATVPLAAFCCTMGVAGTPLAVLPLVYLNLGTTIFLMSTLGLVQPLEPGSGKPTGGIGGNAGWGIMGFVLVAQIVAGARQSLMTPWAGALVGLPTPIPMLVGIGQSDIWQYRLSFYGVQIPFLFVTPVSQLVLAYLFFHVMVRRFINPLNPQFSKATAYVTLIVVDLLAGAVLYDPAGMPLEKRVTGFCLAHLVVSLGLVTAVTPWRESLQSWIWRFRGRSPWLRDLWLGARTENVFALVTFCVIGLVGLALFVLLPAWFEVGAAAVERQAWRIFNVATGSTVLLLSLGTVYQWCVALAGQLGRGVLLTLAMLLILPPHLVGYYYDIGWLQALTPSAQFIAWADPVAMWPLWPMLVLYGALLVLTWGSLRAYVARVEKMVDSKLQQMGVHQPAA
jgi:hypothetical protein